MAESNALRASGYSRPVYYGWWVLAAAALTEMLAVGSTSYASGLFVLPLQNEFSLSRAAANSALSIGLAGAAFMAPIVGYLLDRYPVQWVIGLGVIPFGLGFVTISVTSSIPLMAVAMLIPVGFGAMAIGPLTTSTLTSRWFYRRRGRALGLATVATSGGGIVVVPLLSWAIENYGWRMALRVEAVLIMAIVLALSILILRSGPADLGLEAHKENRGRPAKDMAAAHPGATWRYASILSNLNFWAIALILAAISGIDQAIIVTIVPYGSGLNYPAASTAFFITAFAISAAIVKVMSGFLAEFVERRMIMLAAALAMIAALSFLLFSSKYEWILLACCFAGMALGCVLPSSAALVAAHFGSPSFGRVMGMIYVAVVVSSIVCVRFIGGVFDRTAGYNPAFLTFLVIAVLSALAVLLVRAPQEMTDDVQAADLSRNEPGNIAAKGSPR
ncbi:MAG TPA: MFS transporter [Micropepsaceae bacterium]|nr:MFS transporter [Micropepsaceae bacterium]